MLEAKKVNNLCTILVVLEAEFGLLIPLFLLWEKEQYSLIENFQWINNVLYGLYKPWNG